MLPVWLLLAPRDYLSTFLKIGTIVGLAIGIVVVAPELKMPALTQFVDCLLYTSVMRGPLAWCGARGQAGAGAGRGLRRARGIAAAIWRPLWRTGR